MDNLQIYKGDIFYVHKEEFTGSEQRAERPAIVVSNNVGNEHSPVVMMVFLTTQKKKALPTHVDIYTSKKVSVAMCEQVISIDKSRIGNYVGTVTQDEMDDIERALMIAFGINCDVKATKKLKEWEEMLENDANKKELESSGVNPEEPKPHTVTVKMDTETDPMYIRACAERDVYKELYMDMIHRRPAQEGHYD